MLATQPAKPRRSLRSRIRKARPLAFTLLCVIAVAMLMDMACVIIPEGIVLEEATLQKAEEEGVPVFASDKTAYELCGQMFALGVGQAERT